MSLSLSLSPSTRGCLLQADDRRGSLHAPVKTRETPPEIYVQSEEEIL